MSGREGESGTSAGQAADELTRGREAYEGRDFASACEALTAADRAGTLDGEDLDRLAMSAAMIGRDDESMRALERAHHAHLEAGRDVAAARSAIWLGFRLVAGGETARGRGWLARAQRLLDDGGHDCVERGYVTLVSVRQRLDTKEYAEARAAAVEAIAIGERFGEPDLVAFARNLQGQAFLREERLDEGLELLDEAMVAVSSGELSPLFTGLIYCSIIRSCQDVYELGRAREWTQALKDWCDAQPGAVPFTGACLVHRSEILQWNGDWPGAVEEARHASERLMKTADQRSAAPAFYQQAELHRLKGEFAEAEEEFGNASRWGWEPQPGLALLRLAQGKTDAAASAIRRVLAAAKERLQRTRLLPASVEILLAAGDLEDARRGCRELEEIARKLDTEVVDAMAAHARGALLLREGNAQKSIGPLRASFEIWQKLGAPYLAARVRKLLAEACRAVGDEDGFRLEADAARRIFAELGAAPDLAALEAVAAKAAGEKERPHGLTPRELQVLRLVAAGKTNKAIAAELFVSEKTIDRHVSNIFDKVDVSSRAAATAFAYEHKLV
jgi:ATP/maltotriose-dependent transcriptional regulator MalT